MPSSSFFAFLSFFARAALSGSFMMSAITDIFCFARCSSSWSSSASFSALSFSSRTFFASSAMPFACDVRSLMRPTSFCLFLLSALRCLSSSRSRFWYFSLLLPAPAFIVMRKYSFCRKMRYSTSLMLAAHVSTSSKSDFWYFSLFMPSDMPFSRTQSASTTSRTSRSSHYSGSNSAFAMFICTEMNSAWPTSPVLATDANVL